MFQTIGHKGGYVQLSYIGGKETIKATSHGDQLGDHYQTVAGAKCAITRAHNKWVKEGSADHHNFMSQRGHF